MTPIFLKRSEKIPNFNLHCNTLPEESDLMTDSELQTACDYDPLTFGCDYLREIITPDGLTTIVNQMEKGIQRSGVSFSSIAFTGLSGCFIGPMLAVKLKKGMLAIRKDGESTHSGDNIEGIIDLSHPRYIVVDDLVSSGETVRRIVRSISQRLPRSQCVGVFVWKYGPEVTVVGGEGISVFQC